MFPDAAGLKRRQILEQVPGAGRLRVATYEPISENPVFSFEPAARPGGPLGVRGVDNNGNRIEATV